MGFIENDRIDSLLKRGEVEAALSEPVRNADPGKAGVAAFVSARSGQSRTTEDVAYVGLTLGEFLYDYIRIDPDVVRGVAFARAADVDGMLSFARFAETKADLAGASLNGLHSELQGYVAEQFVAQHLIKQGHDVIFPKTPNNPGWDLRVDGQPFQIKCLADSGGVLEHLHKYPTIPVIVNAELGPTVGDHAGVYVDPELHHDVVRHATEETLERGRELVDFEIPWISLGVSSAFNIYYMLQNDTDLIAMLTCTVTDTVGRTIGATAGKITGAALGALLFGPAGAVVGGLVGTSGGGSAGRRMIAMGRGVFVAEEEAAVQATAARVAEAGAEAMTEKLSAWSEKSELLNSSLAGPATNQQKMKNAMMRRLLDQMSYWKQKKSELEAVSRSPSDTAPSYAQTVLTLLRRAKVHPHHLQAPLKEFFEKLQAYRKESMRFRTAFSTR